MAKKVYSLDELKALAGEILKANPKADKVFATTDGNIFLPENKNAAELHSKSNGNLKIHTILNPDFVADAIADGEEGDEQNPFVETGNENKGKGKGKNKTVAQKAADDKAGDKTTETQAGDGNTTGSDKAAGDAGDQTK